MRESQVVLQLPLWQESPLLQVLLRQHGWLRAPQLTHELFTQVLPPEHEEESQTQPPPEQCSPLAQDSGVPWQLPL